MISVIIPNWNGTTLLPGCLDSLRTQTHPDYEVILVDNASTDDSVEMIRREYPEVRVLELARNLGLTGGVNAGIAIARGEIIALLNNDAEASPAWLTELEAALARHPEAGSVASKMLLYDHPKTINSAGDFYRTDGILGNRGVWQQDDGEFDQEDFVFGGCGGAVAYRRTLLEQIGLFDEDLFMYCEDVDLSWRAQLAGWGCVYAPLAVVHHRLSATGGGVLASYYNGRNCIFVIVKNYPSSLLRKHWLSIIHAQLKIAENTLRAFRGNSARARLRGQLAGLCGIPFLLGKRGRTQSLRRVSDDHLLSVLTEID
ncbi:MAG: glycosyltransferase family 2 protein [Anaerolineae bacterium]|nr:glycosyltransferase family 2 protein [Anaerolineae bacterium]